MRNNEKLHVVEAGDVLDIRDPRLNASTTSLARRQARAPYRAPARPARQTAQASPAPPPPTMHYARLLVFTWLCGPAALVLTPAGRRSRGWLTLGLAAAAAAVTLVLVPYAQFVPVLGPSTSLAWGSLAALATIGGFSAWARAVHLAAAALPPAHKLPRFWRSRAAVCVLGLLAPGCGLLASAGRLRAALALWLLWPAALGLAMLANAQGMWRHLFTTASNSAAADLLEYSLLLAAVAVAAGLLFWVVQALEGARRLAPAPALGRHHGDWFAVALGVSCAALAVGGNPGRVARQLGDAALVLRAEGLSLIPLQFSLAADRLDPSCADYAVQAITLYEERGAQAQADALRARLDDGLASYVALLGSATSWRDVRPAPAAGSRSGDPTRPGAGDLYYGTLARPARAGGR